MSTDWIHRALRHCRAAAALVALTASALLLASSPAMAATGRRPADLTSAVRGAHRLADAKHHDKAKHRAKAKHPKVTRKHEKGPTASAASASGTDPLTTVGVTPTSVSATNPSGTPMPTGNLPGWNQVFSDDFTTSVPTGGFSGCTSASTLMASTCSGLPASVASKLWAYPDGWSDTSGNGQYTPSQVLSIHDNMLDYNLHTSNGIHMVAAVVPKIPGGVNGGGLKYGAYAIRFKSDTIADYKTAFLLWPDSNSWPADGEIDFPEGNLDSTIGGYMHQLGATSGSQQDAYTTNASYSSWHTAVIEWTPNLCRFILDGRVIGTSYSLIPNTPMHWVLQAETALTGGAPADDISGHIDIAWITAYAQSR